jgi:hypothetical protein
VILVPDHHCVFRGPDCTAEFHFVRFVFELGCHRSPSIVKLVAVDYIACCIGCLGNLYLSLAVVLAIF